MKKRRKNKINKEKPVINPIILILLILIIVLILAIPVLCNPDSATSDSKICMKITGEKTEKQDDIENPFQNR